MQCKSAKWFLPETTAYSACLLSTEATVKSFQNAITDAQVCVFQACFRYPSEVALFVIQRWRWWLSLKVCASQE